MKKIIILFIFAVALAFGSCRHSHNETTGTPNSGTTNGPADTTKMSETGSPIGISAQSPTKDLDTNHNIKTVSDSAKK